MKFIAVMIILFLSSSCENKDFIGSQGTIQNPSSEPSNSNMITPSNPSVESGDAIAPDSNDTDNTDDTPLISPPIKTFGDADLSKATSIKITTGSKQGEVGEHIDIEVFAEIGGELIEIDPADVNIKFDGKSSTDFNTETGKFLPTEPSDGTINITAELDGKTAETGIDIVGCVSGSVLGIWLDELSTGELKDENYLGEITTFQGSELAKFNYNYFSASAHPKIGPGTEGFVNKVFFYRDPTGLNLNFISGGDGQGSGGNKVDIEIQTTGNSLNDDVVISDEGGELKRVSSGANINDYTGFFRFAKNTDGGVIGPFAGEDFRISVDILRTGNVKDAKFVSSNGTSFTLKGDSGGISSFVIAFKEEKVCE